MTRWPSRCSRVRIPTSSPGRRRSAGYTGSFTQPALPDVIAVGDSGPRPDDFRPEVEMVLEFIQRVWNDRELEKVDDFLDPRPGAAHRRSTARSSGPRDTDAQLLRMIRPFPAGQFEVRDVATNSDPRYAGLRIAVLWKFSGTTTAPPTSVR